MPASLRLLCVAFLCTPLAACTPDTPTPGPDAEAWVALFDGRSLDGWTPKLRGHALGEDPYNTFRVADSLLQVRYDGYDAFENRFGHLFYQTPFSHYRLRVVYRFVDEQPADGEAWAYQNSGVMIHGQAPETMTTGQDFPISIEVQFLGDDGSGDRPTANLCTPGTHIRMADTLVTQHCISAAAPTFGDSTWVTVEVLALGDSLIVHSVDGAEVLRYTEPTIGGGVVNNFDPAAKPDGTPVTGGTISLQSESHPIDFRTVELLNLAGCMDPEATTYKAYFVHPVPEACVYGE